MTIQGTVISTEKVKDWIDVKVKSDEGFTTGISINQAKNKIVPEYNMPIELNYNGCASSYPKLSQVWIAGTEINI